MFELIFRTGMSNAGAGSQLANEYWSEINASYSRGKRHYHTLLHLDNLAAELLPVKDRIQDWQTLIFSIAYHDIIYNPLRKDNEKRSAEVAVERLVKINYPAEMRDKCYRQILATKEHTPCIEADTNYFTDADLAVLGSESGLYHRYAVQIREEYKVFPDFLYNAGRKKILEHFLAMGSIYKTTWFKEKYEHRARQNILEELNSIH